MLIHNINREIYIHNCIRIFHKFSMCSYTHVNSMHVLCIYLYMAYTFISGCFFFRPVFALLGGIGERGRGGEDEEREK